MFCFLFFPEGFGKIVNVRPGIYSAWSWNWAGDNRHRCAIHRFSSWQCRLEMPEAGGKCLAGSDTGGLLVIMCCSTLRTLKLGASVFEVIFGNSFKIFINRENWLKTLAFFYKTSSAWTGNCVFQTGFVQVWYKVIISNQVGPNNWVRNWCYL